MRAVTRHLPALTAVVLALALTGWLSARLGRAAVLPAVVRTVGVGFAAMALTFAAGSAVGASGVL